jgi:hypothetical protein
MGWMEKARGWGEYPRRDYVVVAREEIYSAGCVTFSACGQNNFKLINSGIAYRGLENREPPII